MKKYVNFALKYLYFPQKLTLKFLKNYKIPNIN